MALTPCKECGKEVSSKAEKCPNCGVAIPQGMSFGTWLGAFFLVYIIYNISTCSSHSTATNQSEPTPAAKPVDPMVEYNALMLKHAEDKRFEVTGALAQTLKNSLRDPKSVEWVNIFANEDASVVCIEYRAKNGFGGLNKEFIVFKNQLPSQSSKVWNKNCVNADLFDMKFVENALK